jgi:hypothetical protein
MCDVCDVYDVCDVCDDGGGCAHLQRNSREGEKGARSNRGAAALQKGEHKKGKQRVVVVAVVVMVGVVVMVVLVVMACV